MVDEAATAPSKTTLRRLEQYRDRWSSYDERTGLIEISDKPSVEELRAIDLLADFDDRFLEKISPDLSIARWRQGSVLFEEGAYVDLAFYVLEGELEAFFAGPGGGGGDRPIFDLERTVQGSAGPPAAAAADATQLMRRATRAAATEITFLATMDFDLPRGAAARLGPGELVGEIGAMSGWPQSVTVRTAGDCRLLQIKVAALRLMKRKSKALKQRLDAIYRERSLGLQLQRTPLFAGCSELFLEAVMENVELVSCEPGEVIATAGEPAAAVYLVRSGFVKLEQPFADGDIAVSYLSKGMTLGEVELLVDGLEGWQSTARSVEYSELVEIPRAVMEQLLQIHPELVDQLWDTATARIREAGFARRDIAAAEFTEVALKSGLVQGSSILAIDLAACTRCDDCVRACAATHGGRPRFVREGNRYGSLLVPKSCFHCRDPVCLVGCPTGAIHRAGVGEVVAVDDEICIGCSNCARNCPYDAIVMHDAESVWPDDMIPTGLRGRDRELASKCDLCADTGHGPACVSNCPQGCAYRVGSIEEFQRLLAGSRQ